MSSENASRPAIPYRTLSIVLAVCSAVIPFAKWFRIDVAGLASLFSIDTSFSVFQLRGVIEASFGQVPLVYTVVLGLFVLMAALQAAAAVTIFCKNSMAGFVSAAACIYSTLLSLAAMALCSYISAQGMGATLGCTLFPFLAIVLAIGESLCLAKDEGRPFLTKAQLVSLLLLVAGAVVWGLIVSLAHTSILGDIILFFAVFQYWVMFLAFRASSN